MEEWSDHSKFPAGSPASNPDENYIRESIYEPSAKIVQGYASPSVMPTFKGTIKDTDIDAIIAYMKTLKAQ